MTSYYVDSQGKFLGGFDGALPPLGAVLVPTPPTNGADTWDGAQWLPIHPTQAETDRATREAAYDSESGNQVVGLLRTSAPSAVRQFVLNNALLNPFGAANSGARQILAEIFVAIGFALRGGRDA